MAKLKKINKKKKRKYLEGGQNYGQLDYGSNSMTSDQTVANQMYYTDQLTKNYSENVLKDQNNLKQNQEFLANQNNAEYQKNLTDGTSRLMNKFRKSDGTGVKEKAENLFKTKDVTNFANSYNPGGEAFSGIAPKGTTAIQYADGAQASLAPGQAIPEGASALGNAAPSAAAQTMTNLAATSNVVGKAANVGNAISPYALPAYIVGEGVGYLADDDDPTTWTAGEISGDLLSSTGSGVGTGATIGSALGPAGAGVGAVIGGIYGLGKGIYDGVTDRGDARNAETEGQDQFSEDFADYRRNLMLGQEQTGFASSQYGDVYRGRDGGIKPMNNKGDMVVYGPTHEQGGVLRDQTTELEGGGMRNGKELPGEVITQVMDNGGVPREYYFSDHLKNPSTGNTFAEDYRKSGGMNMNSKQLFAKLQEQIAGRTDKDRSPQTIAEDGGYGPMLPTMSSDTIQGLSSEQNAAKLRFERNIQKGGLNPFSRSVKSNTTISKDNDGNFIYRYITPTTENKNGGYGKRLDKISDELAGASKMHAGQSKKIESMAKQLLKKNYGGYKMYANGGPGEGQTQFDMGTPDPNMQLNEDGSIGSQEPTYSGGTLPEVTIEDRRTRSEFEKLLNLRGLQKELDFFNYGALDKTPIGAIENTEDAVMAAASFNPVGLGRNMIKKQGLKFFKNILKRKPVTVKDLPTRNIPLPGGGVITGQPNMLPTVYKAPRTATSIAKNILNNSRDFIKDKKFLLGDITKGLGVAGVTSYLINQALPEDKGYTELEGIEALNQLNAKYNTPEAKTDTTLTGSQQYILNSLRDGSMKYGDVEYMGNKNPDMLQGVVDSVKTAEGYAKGGFRYEEGGPKKPGKYRFNQPAPNRFDMSLEANSWRRRNNAYNKSLETTTTDSVPNTTIQNNNTQNNTTVTDSVSTVAPQFKVLDVEKVKKYNTAKALSPEEIAALSEEELDAYFNATSLGNLNMNVNLDEVVINENSPEAQRRIDYEAGKPKRMEFLNNAPGPDQSYLPGLNDINFGIEDSEAIGNYGLGEINEEEEIYTDPAITAFEAKNAEQNQINPISLKKSDSIDTDLLFNTGPAGPVAMPEFNETVDANYEGPYPEGEDAKVGEDAKTEFNYDGDAGFDLKSLLSKVGLDNINAGDAIATAVSGLGLAKANKLAKEMGELELDVKADVTAERVPKQNISFEVEKKKLQQDTNALVQEMTKQGKSTSEILAAQAQARKGLEQLQQTEKNMQSSADIKVDSLNATNDFKAKATNKQVDLQKAIADLDISAAEKRNRMAIWNKLTNDVSGMAMDAKKLKSVEKQMDVLAKSMGMSDAMYKDLLAQIQTLIK